jgi:cell division septum initiation protein DivIVA
MSSKIEQMIDQIEDFIDSCRYQTFSKTNIIVDKDELDALLEELRAKVPDEIRHYQRIVANKEAILEDARRKADEMINEANVHSNELVNEHEIMQQAYAQANDIVRMATQQGQDILDKAMSEANGYKEAANQYMDSMLADLEKSTVSAQNNLTAIFHNFYDEMSDYIDTVRQNRAELSPQDDNDDDSGLMQEVDEGEPYDYEEGEDDSEFVNTDMVQE